MGSLASERSTVQEPLIGYAVAVGWSRLSESDALSQRQGASGLLLYGVLREKLLELNPGIVTPENVDGIVQRIEGARSSIEGNAEIMAWVRGQRTVFVEAEKRARNVTVVEFDPDRLDRNRFHVTDEWSYTNGRHTNRADVVFLVNGIPMTIVECKSARKGIDDGLEQVRRYHRETPEMMTAPQVFDLTNLFDFCYGVTWGLERKNLFPWKDESEAAPSFEIRVKRFFTRSRFLTMLRDWILFYTKDDELRKAILRQHQTRAVEKVVQRVLDAEKRRGLVWHTQGSGKTFTMIKTADLLLRHPSLERPTVVMLVDRNELESQLFTNLQAYGLDWAPATSKKKLAELLRSDFRGLIVSMIHKFEKADADLCTRSNVVILADEAHRSTGGDLGNYLVAALPNATIIGFTGTPIDKTAYGQGTFKTFGVDDHPKGYLDKYSIADSIKDGTTLPLHYTLAPNDIRVPKEVLEKEFLQLKEAEGVSDIEELNKILEKAVALKAFLKADDRVKHVAAFVAKHYRETIEPLGYKAFLVGVDRHACALYKKALDQLLPPEWSQVVYTGAHNDDEVLAEYHLEEDAEKRVRKAFIKRDSLPKILIVTEKLLTGYDAPILYAMYLDKPMRDHALLQAIARVNRPYEDEQGIKKPCGFVVDFVGIFERLQDALAFDSDEVASVITNIDRLKERFQIMMAGDALPYLALSPDGAVDDKTVERAVSAFTDKDARERFYQFYKNLENLYEILSPDAFLRPYIDPYAKLSVLYRIVKQRYTKRTMLVKDLMRKTEDLVRTNAVSSGIAETLPVVPITHDTIQALKDARGDDAGKVINLGRNLVQQVVDEGANAAHLIPIGERAEAVLDRFEDRQESTESALKELLALHEEYLEAKREATQAGFNDTTFAIFRVLRLAKNDPADAGGKRLGESEAAYDPAAPSPEKELANAIAAILARFPNHRDNPVELRQAKAELYKLLLPAVGKAKMVKVTEEILRVARP